jgi:hypothetical protein
MRRGLIVAVCLSALALGSSGCASVSQRQVDRDIAVYDTGIQEALHNALYAETAWERELWSAEYGRRARKLDRYLDAAQAERAARAEHWRQVSLTAQEAGLAVLELALWGDEGS